MRRRHEAYVVTITHSCTENQDAIERGLRMWAAFLAENRRHIPNMVRRESSTPDAS